MDQDYPSMLWVHLVLGVLAALNVALNTWLVNRRHRADVREHKRNGTPVPAFHGVPKSVAQVQRDESEFVDTGKE